MSLRYFVFFSIFVALRYFIYLRYLCILIFFCSFEILYIFKILLYLWDSFVFLRYVFIKGISHSLYANFYFLLGNQKKYCLPPPVPHLSRIDLLSRPQNRRQRRQQQQQRQQPPDGSATCKFMKAQAGRECVSYYYLPSCVVFFFGFLRFFGFVSVARILKCFFGFVFCCLWRADWSLFRAASSCAALLLIIRSHYARSRGRCRLNDFINIE